MAAVGTIDQSGDARRAPRRRSLRTVVFIAAAACLITAPLAPSAYLMRGLQSFAVIGIATVGVRRWRATGRPGWATIGGSALGWTVALAIGWVSVGMDSPDLLRIARGVFGLSTMAGIVGLVQLLRIGSARQTVIQTLDAVVLASGAVAVLSIILRSRVEVDVVTERLGTPWVGLLASFCMAAIAVSAAIGQPTRPLARWLAIGLSIGLAGDLLQLLQISSGVSGTSNVFSAVLAAGALAVLGAVLTEDHGPPDPQHVPPWRREVLAGMVFGALLVALAEVLSGAEPHLLTYVAGVVMLASQSAALLLALSDLRQEADSGRRLLSELRISEARLNATVDSTPVGIGVAAEHGTIVLANAALADMVGMEVEDLLGRRWQDFMDRVAPLSDDPGEDDEPFWLHHIDGTDRLIEVTRRNYPTDGSEELWLAAIVDVTERVETLAELAHRADHDELTDLANRGRFSSQLENHIASGAEGMLLVLDLDQFKYINDTLGHSAGDELLVATAQRLRNLSARGCTVARIGGDEFCVLTPPGMADPLDTVGAVFDEAFDLDGERIHTTASLGATTTRPSATAEDLIAEADAAMYRAKALGPGRREMYLPSTGASMARHRRTVGELHQALEEHQLELWYQPVVDIATGGIDGFEALMRWQHPSRGMLTPKAFLPIAERAGMIGALGRWAMHSALLEASRGSWTASGSALAINISSTQLADPDFVATVAECLEETGYPADRLWLEITESALLADERTAGRTCAGLSALGLHLAIDDFGTGFGSLTYLLQFPVEAIKIDRSFVSGIGTRRGDRAAPAGRRTDRGAAIVASLVGLSERLGLLCIAEGVERAEQLDALRELGCPLAQGHHLGRPTPFPVIPDRAGVVGTPTGRGPLHGTAEGVS